jgi:hypothetical protein
MNQHASSFPSLESECLLCLVVILCEPIERPLRAISSSIANPSTVQVRYSKIARILNGNTDGFLGYQILPAKCTCFHYLVLFRFGTLRAFYRCTGRFRIAACSEDQIRRMGERHSRSEESYGDGYGG